MVRRIGRRRLLVVLAVSLAIGSAAVGDASVRQMPALPRSLARSPVSSRNARLPVPSPIPGFLLIADRGNNRVLLIDNQKRILWRYPRPGTKPSFPFVFDDDVFFGPNLRSIISNQEDQQTIQVISFPQGRVLWHYGHVNQKGSAPGYLNTPDDAYLLASGLRTVADAYNCRILFISPGQRIVRQYGQAGVCRHDPPRLLGPVNGGTPLPDGGILISEISGSWVDRISASGRLVRAFQAPVSYPSDPQLIGGGHILLADYARPGHVLIMTGTGRVLWRYGPASGPGELDHPSLAFSLGNGLIAVNDDFRHRIVLISIKLHRIVWQYGHTDTKGTAPGYLNTPDGMDLLPYRKALADPKIRVLVSTR